MGVETWQEEWPEGVQEEALRLTIAGMPSRAIAAELFKRYGFKRSHVAIHNRVKKLLADRALLTPLTRPFDPFVTVLQDQGTTSLICRNGTSLTPWHERWTSDPWDVDDEWCRGEFWLYGWHKEKGTFIGKKKRATNTTTVLKCCDWHNYERRARQVGRADACLDGVQAQYVFTEYEHYRSASRNAKRNEIPLALRSTNTERGKLYLVFAAGEITTRRTEDRGNLRRGSKDSTLELMDQSFCYVEDLARVQTTLGLHLYEDNESERDDVEPSGYEMHVCGVGMNPFVIASEVLNREVKPFDSLSESEREKVQREIERRRRDRRAPWLKVA